LRKEWIFVWSIIAADKRMQAFSLGEKVVAEGDASGQRQVTRGYREGIGVVDGSIEGKLNSLDEMEGDCVLESTEVGSVSAYFRILVNLT
jgi:hypothetical protein